MRIMKMMKTVLKKMKAKKHLTLDHNIVKKLLKLRKWMDQINPDFQVNDQETNNWNETHHIVQWINEMENMCLLLQAGQSLSFLHWPMTIIVSQTLT